jgi:cell wall-associated NlpC family hydrolase
MTPEQVSSLIGRRYELGADGPESYDCRGLLLHCQRAFFGKALPDLPMGQAMRDLFGEQLDSGHWEQVDQPSHGDAALLRGGDHPHVGVYLALDEPGVLYALEGVGVIWSPKRTWRLLGFSRVRYIRFHDARGAAVSSGD